MRKNENGYIEKRSSEFRGADRCKVLRNYDGLNGILDTVKESNFDEAILMKDLMKGYLAGKYKPGEFMGLVEEGLDDEQMLLPEQRKAKAERLCKLFLRAANSEKRQATFVGPKHIVEGEYQVTVFPDAAFFEQDSVEVVLYRLGKPTVTQKGHKQDASVNNCLELYFLLRYARTLVPAGKIWKVKASYYFMRKTTDTADTLSDMDFFSGNGGNVVTLEEVWSDTMGDTPNDEMFRDQLETYTEGSDMCGEDNCRYCKMYTQCFWQKLPEKYEEKTLSGKQGKIVPSDAQQRVIDFREGYCKVNAGAGTGKTECMTERGARMFEAGTDPHKMLFITFTEAGATEMKERLAKKASARGLNIGTDDIQAMTFNSFDFQIVKENYAELGFTAMPNVIDRVRNYVTITRLLEEKEIPGLDYLNYTMDHGALACVSKVIEVIKAENLDPDDPASVNNLQHAIIDSGYISSLDTNQLRDILALCKRYNEELKKDNLVQFADQEPLANKFLDAHPDYLEERYGFEHIVVDEFQDSNDGQLDKIKRLCACPSFKSLMVVGDDAQSIYSFRNTSPDNIIHFFTKMGVSGTELFLTENRRSCEEVVELSNAVNDLNTEKVDKTMVSTRGNGGSTRVKGFFKKQDEYAWIADQIGELIDSGVQPEEIAFIAFTKNEISEMSAALSKNRIPWVMKNPLRLMENSRVKAALSLAMAFYEPDATKCYFDYLVAQHDGDLIADMDDDAVTEVVEQLKDSFESMEDLPFDVQRVIFHQMLDDIKGDDEIYAHFLDLVYANEDLQSELEYIRDFKRYGEKEEKRMEQKYEGVTLVTAHSSKGLEWKYVFNSVSKYDSEYLHKNSRNSKKRLEETRRLLFVSMTRARDSLTVTGQYIAYGTKETGYEQNQFLREVYQILGETYDPVDHEAEKRKAEKEAAKKSRKKKTA
ncbi:ATP-dependent helicase [Clostridium sp. MCC328]|uniref:ATP-dependent helicase n=1 Tax=Clostridium sp. MCC328 TaxID=2592642 RepID=UPI001C024BD4|nr:ATP-dependent helicase [Clostridium sp. MCC328]MBT9820247.1 AAA family ATPase [Clostridium sp. MCC328]